MGRSSNRLKGVSSRERRLGPLDWLNFEGGTTNGNGKQPLLHQFNLIFHRLNTLDLGLGGLVRRGTLASKNISRMIS